MAARTLLVVAFLVLTSSAAFAQLPFAPRPDKDAYRNLFSEQVSSDRPTEQTLATAAPSDLLARARESHARGTPQKPIVVCGTKIIPADPTIDPGIRFTPPDAGATHTLRTIAPAICRPQ